MPSPKFQQQKAEPLAKSFMLFHLCFLLNYMRGLGLPPPYSRLNKKNRTNNGTRSHLCFSLSVTGIRYIKQTQNDSVMFCCWSGFPAGRPTVKIFCILSSH
jgi:hypothetical protein